MTRLLMLTLAALFVAGCAALAPQTIHFESSDVGHLPRDFSTALTGGGGPVSWVAREDAEAPGGVGLFQESADQTKYRFPMCIYDKARARDVAAEVKYKAISGKVDESGGIVLRYRPENYYIARANSLEDNVILFKTVKGKRSPILEVPAKVAANVWHTLRFEANGERLKISFDGRTVLETNDDTFSGSGKVGLWTKADSVTEFSDFKIEPVR
jgi:hypothetical protein